MLRYTNFYYYEKVYFLFFTFICWMFTNCIVRKG